MRLALSLATAARSSDLPGVVTAKIMEALVEEYAREFGTRDRPSPPQPLSISRPMQEAKRRSWRHLADECVDGETHAFPIGKQFWPVSREEREAIDLLFESEERRALATRLGYRKDGTGVKVLDCAYWRKDAARSGATVTRFCSTSAARRRAAATFACSTSRRQPGRSRRDTTTRGCRAITPSAWSWAPCNLSPFLGERMAHARVLERPVFVREHLPKDLKLELERVDTQEAIEVARYLARIVGRSHARQLARAERKAWQAELRRNRSKGIDAPSWLWAAVVDLVAVHERAYLDHCRRYALKAA